jgi:hypothetical protein
MYKQLPYINALKHNVQNADLKPYSTTCTPVAENNVCYRKNPLQKWKTTFMFAPVSESDTFQYLLKTG